MTTIQPTNPFHISRAYGVTPAKPVVPPTPTEKVATGQSETTSSLAAIGRAQHSPTMRQLIATTVPGGVDFTGDTPAPTGPVIPMYRHPADKNVAATSLSAGRMIDVSG